MPLEYSIVLHDGTPNEVTLEGRPQDPHACILLQQVSGLDAPAVDAEVTPWPGGDGDTLGWVSARGRVVALEGLIIAPTRGQLRGLERALRRACAVSTGTWPLAIRGREGDPPLALDVRLGEPLVTADEGSSSQGWGKPFRVAFRSASSTLRAAAESSLDVTPPAPGGGLSFPLVFPLVFTGPAATPSGAVARNQGDAPTWPRVAIHGEALNPTLWNVHTGQRIRLSTVVCDDETVTIDMRARTVTSDGPSGGNRYQTVDRSVSNWWQLQPGDNLIRLITDGSGPNGRATVTWHDAYL